MMKIGPTMIRGVGRRSLHVNIIAPPPPLMGALMYILYTYVLYILPLPWWRPLCTYRVPKTAAAPEPLSALRYSSVHWFPWHRLDYNTTTMQINMAYTRTKLDRPAPAYEPIRLNVSKHTHTTLNAFLPTFHCKWQLNRLTTMSDQFPNAEIWCQAR